MNHMERARKLRRLIVKAAQSLDDRDASAGPEMFEGMKYGGSLIPSGTRVNWYGVLKQAAVDLWDTEGNNPDNAPALWQDIAYRNGIRIIPQSITVTEAFSKGECGWWNDMKYESLMDENVYTPEDYPAGWRMLTD